MCLCHMDRNKAQLQNISKILVIIKIKFIFIFKTQNLTKGQDYRRISTPLIDSEDGPCGLAYHKI